MVFPFDEKTTREMFSACMLNSGGKHSYPKVLTVGELWAAEEKFGQNWNSQEFTVFQIWAAMEKPALWDNRLEYALIRAQLNDLLVTMTWRGPPELLEKLKNSRLAFTTSETILSNVKGKPCVASCSIDSQIAHIHTSWLDLSAEEQFKILYHEFISHIALGLSDKDNAAIEDTEDFIWLRNNHPELIGKSIGTFGMEVNIPEFESVPDDQRTGRNGGVNVALCDAGRYSDVKTDKGMNLLFGPYLKTVNSKVTTDREVFYTQGPLDILEKLGALAAIHHEQPVQWRNLMLQSYLASDKVTAKAMERRYARDVYARLFKQNERRQTTAIIKAALITGIGIIAVAVSMVAPISFKSIFVILGVAVVFVLSAVVVPPQGCQAIEQKAFKVTKSLLGFSVTYNNRWQIKNVRLLEALEDLTRLKIFKPHITVMLVSGIRLVANEMTNNTLRQVGVIENIDHVSAEEVEAFLRNLFVQSTSHSPSTLS
ncbi:MAG: hypothetical protein NTZ48_00455, partial [Candidatus Omnitrophica bacterium]|nr:hypothetical protein [Candidatus Omnitrophota bacterium]